MFLNRLSTERLVSYGGTKEKSDSKEEQRTAWKSLRDAKEIFSSGKEAVKQSQATKTPEQLRQRDQRVAVILFACALLTGFLVFLEGESAWLFLHNLILGLFGACAILWPIFLLYIAVVTTLERKGSRLRTKMWLAVAIIFMFCSAIYIFRSDSMPERVSYWEMLGLLYQRGIDHESVGLVSGVLGYPLVLLLGSLGAKIVIVLFLFVAIMLLTGTSLIQLFRTVTKPVNKVAENINTVRGGRSQERQTDLLASDIDIPLGPAKETAPISDETRQMERNKKLERLQKVFGIPEAPADDETEEISPKQEAESVPPPVISDTTVEEVQAAISGHAGAGKEPRRMLIMRRRKRKHRLYPARRYRPPCFPTIRQRMGSIIFRRFLCWKLAEARYRLGNGRIADQCEAFGRHLKELWRTDKDPGYLSRPFCHSL